MVLFWCYFKTKEKLNCQRQKSVQFEPSSDLQTNILDFGEVQAGIFKIKTDEII